MLWLLRLAHSILFFQLDTFSFNHIFYLLFSRCNIRFSHHTSDILRKSDYRVYQSATNIPTICNTIVNVGFNIFDVAVGKDHQTIRIAERETILYRAEPGQLFHGSE